MNALTRTLSSLWHLLDVVLEPVMAVLVGVPARLHPLLGLLPVSVLLGAAMVLLFKAVSNQQLIGELRDRMKGHLLGALVFSHSFRIVMRCLGRALRVNLRYLLHAFLPLLIMMFPVLLLYVQLQQWYSWRPPGPQEDRLVCVRYRGAAPEPIRLRAVGAGRPWQIGPAFVFPSARTVAWRVNPGGGSSSRLLLEAGGAEFPRTVVASTDRLVPLSPRQTDGSRVLEGFLYPHEPLLPVGAGIESIEFAYPPRRLPGEPWYTHWAVWFFGLTLGAGLIWSRLLGVRL